MHDAGMHYTGTPDACSHDACMHDTCTEDANTHDACMHDAYTQDAVAYEASIFDACMCDACKKWGRTDEHTFSGSSSRSLIANYSRFRIWRTYDRHWVF